MTPVYGSGYAPLGPPRVNYGWIGEAWNWFTQAAGIWIVGILVYSVMNLVLAALIHAVFPNPAYIPPPSPFPGQFHASNNYGPNSDLTPLGQIVSLLLTWGLGAFQGASLYHLAVKQIRGEAVSFADIFGGAPYWGQMLIYNVLAFLATIAGALVFCVGLWVAMGFLLPAQAMIADGAGALEAISRSVDAMKQDWLNATGFAFIFTVLIALSAIPCLLGLLVTIPMLNIISALAYRDMAGMPGLPPLNMNIPPTAPPPGPGVWPPPPSA